MASYLGVSKSYVSDYVNMVADALSTNPRDERLWLCGGITEAFQLLRQRAEDAVTKEMERRRQEALKTKEIIEVVKQAAPEVFAKANQSIVQELDKTPEEFHRSDTWKPVDLLSNLAWRANKYNEDFSHLTPPNTKFHYDNKEGKEFISSFWFVGGGNISPLYGSYQVEYLKRINSLLSHGDKVVHLFVGSLPPSDRYIRVGLPQGDVKPDIECDAHHLSSVLPQAIGPVDIIFADPPYSHEDAEHYANAMVNRERVLEECALCLSPWGLIFWMDVALPIFSNEMLELVGAITYIRSTGNRYRVISIFRKAKCKNTPSPESTNEFE
jgi:hypothetical protein